MNKLLSQIEIAPNNGFTGFGTLGEGQGEASIGVFSDFLSKTIGLMTIIAIIWFIFTFILGAIGIITAGSDKQALEGSRKRIVNGIIGLVVTIAAIFVIQLIGYLLGFEDILNIQSMFESVIGVGGGTIGGGPRPRP